MRTDPAVSVPTASGTWPAATAAADPPEEPPGMRSTSCGLRWAPSCRRTRTRASSSCRERLRLLAAAARPRQRPSWPRRAPGPTSAGTRRPWAGPATSMRSLTPTGTPCSGPRQLAGTHFLVQRAGGIARARASSRTHACSEGSPARTDSRADLHDLGRRSRPRRARPAPVRASRSASAFSSGAGGAVPGGARRPRRPRAARRRALAARTRTSHSATARGGGSAAGTPAVIRPGTRLGRRRPRPDPRSCPRRRPTPAA